MGAFRSPCFVAEFLYRTQWNYFKLRYLQETDPEKASDIRKKIDVLEYEMRVNGYEISDFFEITQLINSLIGLLVFPEQEGYEQISNNPSDLKEMLPLLNEYVNNRPGRYNNTYKERIREVPFLSLPAEYKSPKNIIRHLRNAASHKKIGIRPLNGEIVEGRQEIREVVFEDSCGIKNKGTYQEFELKIAVEDLEPLLLEIGNVLLQIVQRIQ